MIFLGKKVKIIYSVELKGAKPYRMAMSYPASFEGYYVNYKMESYEIIKKSLAR